MIHRDIKPTNILVDAQGVPYLVDFGLAKLLAGSADVTQTLAVLGTPHYMAPEQALVGGKDVPTKADVYSLGAVLYEMLTGRPPFQGESVLEILEQIRQASPRPLRELNPQVSGDLETICLKCLEKNADSRYRSAEALAEDLDRWLSHEPIQARPTTRLERLRKWVRRNPTISVLSGLLALTLLAGLCATFWGGDWPGNVNSKPASGPMPQTCGIPRWPWKRKTEAKPERCSKAICRNLASPICGESNGDTFGKPHGDMTSGSIITAHRFMAWPFHRMAAG